MRPGIFSISVSSRPCCPASRVIHCRRHPLDTALSCFSQDFQRSGTGLEPAALEHIAVYFYEGYRSLMDHWAAVLASADHRWTSTTRRWSPNRKHRTRRMLDFLGLELGPGLSGARSRSESAATASYAQVARPIYRSSVGRSSHHYAAQLAPLAQAAQDSRPMKPEAVGTGAGQTAASCRRRRCRDDDLQATAGRGLRAAGCADPGGDGGAAAGSSGRGGRWPSARRDRPDGPARITWAGS